MYIYIYIKGETIEFYFIPSSNFSTDGKIPLVGNAHLSYCPLWWNDVEISSTEMNRKKRPDSRTYNDSAKDSRKTSWKEEKNKFEN